MEKLKLFLIVILVVIVDQITKFIVRVKFSENKQKRLFNFLYISYIKNTGGAFGLFRGMNNLIIIISFIIILAIIFYYRKLPQNFLRTLSVGLFLGGAIGNLIDRIVFGFVTDFIDFNFWPAFNIADLTLTVGAALLIIHTRNHLTHECGL